jgi:hypothetical protein
MKKLTRFFLFSLAVPSMLFLSSCEKKNIDTIGTGTAEFSISLPDSQITKSSAETDSISVSYQVMISVEDLQGHAVFTDKLIPIYVFGNDFVSENIEIRAGEFRLTKFMVINPSGEVIYAAPVAGSPLAYLTNKPLPFNFNIFPDQVTRVLPEVLAVNGQTPDKFGYVSFGIQVIKPLDFWTMCVLDPGDPRIMAPIQITTAKLTVYAPDGWHYTFRLEAAANHLVIRGGYEKYIFLLEKEGFFPQKLEFTARELMAATRENPLILKISWFSQYKTLILQPGPDKGKDAMISNLEPDKNFGDHKYFEATFLSEPILTVMRSNRSLIYFSPDSLPKSAIIRKVMLRLSYDIPVPFDSIYILNTGPSDGIAWYGGVLQQIVEPWDEHKVTWNTQPKTIETNQVYIPPFIRNVNFIDVDVTRLFVTPANTDPAVYPNYGMLFRLWPSDQFPGFRFASSDFPEPKMRPMLTIYYSLN